MRHRRGTALGRIAMVAALALPLSALGMVPAQAEHPQRELTVMTQNLYLGSSLAPAITATTPQDFVIGVATIYGTVLFTNFPTRAAAIADTVAAERPDLVGLQEVSKWTVSGPTTAPSLDFLQILQDQLAARGLHYAVAAVSDNADIGPVPLAAPCAGPVGACLLRFQDRDVILVNTDTPRLLLSRGVSGRYAAQEVLTTPVGSLSFNRGWAYVDGRFGGERFRFVTTHLETEDFPLVQQAEGQELLAGPTHARGSVIAVGDFNSAADGSTTTTYADLTRRVFRDAWRTQHHDPGLSCCQNGTLTNPVSEAASRIDLVLTHDDVTARSAHLVGTAPFEAAPPFWASDHFGLVADVRLH